MTLSLVFASDASINTNTIIELILFQRENGLHAGISTSASTKSIINYVLIII